MRRCETCGRSIEGKRSNARYCGAACRAKGSQQRTTNADAGPNETGPGTGVAQALDTASVSTMESALSANDELQGHESRPLGSDGLVSRAEARAMIAKALDPLARALSRHAETGDDKDLWLEERLDQLEQQFMGHMDSMEAWRTSEQDDTRAAQVRDLAKRVRTIERERAAESQEIGVALSVIFEALSLLSGVDLRDEIQRRME